jgi:hypothetical protein
MGLPFFCWQPHSRSAHRVHLSLGEDLSDLQITPIRDVSDSVSIQGKFSRTTGRPSIAVRVVLERFTDREMFRRLSAMINHLERGGIVGFGLDDTKAYAATTKGVHFQNSRSFTVGPNLFNAYAPASTSLVRLTGSTSAPYGDEFVIESSAPIAAREYFAAYSSASTPTGDTLVSIDETGGGTTNLRCHNDYPEGALLRHSDFYPFLFMPASGVGGALLTHEHRIAYTFDLRLEYIIPDYEWTFLQQPPEKEVSVDPDKPGATEITPAFDIPEIFGARSIYLTADRDYFWWE